MTEQILDKMEELIDVPMTYKQLCESFDEKYYTGGKAKVAQIKEWQLFCDLEITNKPTRYIIHAVYRNNLECYEQMERRRDLQPLFDATLYEWIKSNHYSTIYASYPEILKALQSNYPDFVVTETDGGFKPATPPAKGKADTDVDAFVAGFKKG